MASRRLVDLAGIAAASVQIAKLHLRLRSTQLGHYAATSSVLNPVRRGPVGLAYGYPSAQTTEPQAESRPPAMPEVPKSENNEALEGSTGRVLEDFKILDGVKPTAEAVPVDAELEKLGEQAFMSRRARGLFGGRLAKPQAVQARAEMDAPAVPAHEVPLKTEPTAAEIVHALKADPAEAEIVQAVEAEAELILAEELKMDKQEIERLVAEASGDLKRATNVEV